MIKLNSKEREQVLSVLIRTEEPIIKFTKDNFNDIFQNLNCRDVERYLMFLSHREIIKFKMCTEDNCVTEYIIENIDYEKTRDELFSVKNKDRQLGSKKNLEISMMLVGLIMMLITIYSLFFPPYSTVKELFSVSMGLILAMVTFLIISVLRKDRDIKEVTQYSEKLKRTMFDSIYKATNEKGVSKIDENVVENDALNLMLVNMTEIKAYYTLSKSQAKNSFRLSVWMCILGFILLVAAVILPFLTSGKYEISVITAIGGAIVEVIAGTSLFVYRNSLSQLNHYYESLHDNERFLSTVNLVRKISKEKQDDMYIEIIRSCIKDMEKNNENE